MGTKMAAITMAKVNNATLCSYASQVHDYAPLLVPSGEALGKALT
jgi:hypothetical protein